MDPNELAGRIDHTALKAEVTLSQIEQLSQEAIEYRFKTVCVNPYFVAPVKKYFLPGSTVKLCTVVGFPLGACGETTKAFQTRLAIDEGADEIDMVINLGALLNCEALTVARDIRAVRKATPSSNVLKVIIESSALADFEISEVSKICVGEGADFVKTSTGFHATGGAKIEHVKLIKQAIGNRALIKASGGISTLDQLLEMKAAGADRFGLSKSVPIIEEAIKRFAASK